MRRGLIKDLRGVFDATNEMCGQMHPDAADERREKIEALWLELKSEINKAKAAALLPPPPATRAP